MEDSRAIRQAAAELVAGMLEPQGKRFIAQVSSHPRRPAGVCDKNVACPRELQQGFMNGYMVKLKSMHRHTRDGCKLNP